MVGPDTRSKLQALRADRDRKKKEQDRLRRKREDLARREAARKEQKRIEAEKEKLLDEHTFATIDRLISDEAELRDYCAEVGDEAGEIQHQNKIKLLQMERFTAERDQENKDPEEWLKKDEIIQNIADRYGSENYTIQPHELLRKRKVVKRPPKKVVKKRVIRSKS